MKLPIVAIAKGKFRNSGNETFFIMVKSLNLQKMTLLFFFLQRIEMKLIDLQ